MEFVLIEFVYFGEYECDPSDRCGHHDCDLVVVCTDHCHCRSCRFRSSLVLVLLLELVLLFRLLAWKMASKTRIGQMFLPVMVPPSNTLVRATAGPNQIILGELWSRSTANRRRTRLRTNPLSRTRRWKPPLMVPRINPETPRMSWLPPRREPERLSSS